MTDELRRADDRRIVSLDRKVGDLDRKVTEIRDMLISEPESSPLGRALLKRSEVNAQHIHDLDQRVDSLEGWRSEAKGAYAAARIIQVLLAVIVAILTILNFVQAAGG